jgi:hypothetical protein
MAKARKKKARKPAKRAAKKRKVAARKRKVAAKRRPAKARRAKPRKSENLAEALVDAALEAGALRSRLAGHNTFED